MRDFQSMSAIPRITSGYCVLCNLLCTYFGLRFLFFLLLHLQTATHGAITKTSFMNHKIIQRSNIRSYRGIDKVALESAIFYFLVLEK